VRVADEAGEPIMYDRASQQRDAVALLGAFVEGSVTADELIERWPAEHRDRLLAEIVAEFGRAAALEPESDLKRTAEVAIRAVEGQWVPEAFRNALEIDVPRSVTARRSFTAQVAVASAAIIALVVILAFALTAPANRFSRAVREGDIRRVQQLLEAHPEFLEAEDRDGWMPIERAVARDDPELVRFLIARGAHFGRRGDRDWTLLHQAARVGSAQAAAVLLAEGADVNARDNFGRTPLHLASQRGLKDIVEILLANGADLKARDEQGNTALKISEKWGQTEVSELLHKHGAEE